MTRPPKGAGSDAQVDSAVKNVLIIETNFDETSFTRTTLGNHVIHLSRWWNPAVEDQCSDRVYRIGQTKPVHIYYPLALLPDAAEHSFDWQLQVLMDRKRKLAQNLLAAPAFNESDYQDLIAGLKR